MHAASPRLNLARYLCRHTVAWADERTGTQTQFSTDLVLSSERNSNKTEVQSFSCTDNRESFTFALIKAQKIKSGNTCDLTSVGGKEAGVLENQFSYSW
jgi:hypothetical protein